MDAVETHVRFVAPGQSIHQRVHKGNISHGSDIRVRVVYIDGDFVIGNRMRLVHENPKGMLGFESRGV